MSQSPYWKPKFYAGAFAQVSSTVLVAVGLIDSGAWVTVTLGSLAIYSGTNVYENKVLRNAPATP